jgi:hypothetical protein
MSQKHVWGQVKEKRYPRVMLEMNNLVKSLRCKEYIYFIELSNQDRQKKIRLNFLYLLNEVYSHLTKEIQSMHQRIQPQA